MMLNSESNVFVTTHHNLSSIFNKNNSNQRLENEDSSYNTISLNSMGQENDLTGAGMKKTSR